MRVYFTIILFSAYFINPTYSQMKIKYNPNLISIKKISNYKYYDIFIVDFQSFINPLLIKDRVKSVRVAELSPKESHNFIYGKRRLQNLEIIFYTNEYLPWENDGKILYDKTEGFLLLLKGDKTAYAAKTFESKIDSEKILVSYLFDNYIILIEKIDYGFDTVINNQNNKDVEYSFAILELLLDGKLNILKEQQARKIANKYLSNLNEFKGKF
jgi:hypothetical protein